LTGKTGEVHVGKSSRRWENKSNIHLKLCKEETWNAFNWLQIRTNDGAFCKR